MQSSKIFRTRDGALVEWTCFKRNGRILEVKKYSESGRRLLGNGITSSHMLIPWRVILLYLYAVSWEFSSSLFYFSFFFCPRKYHDFDIKNEKRMLENIQEGSLNCYTKNEVVNYVWWIRWIQSKVVLIFLSFVLCILMSVIWFLFSETKRMRTVW